MPNKIALVTGGGSGVGRASALALQSVGYDVVIAGRRISELEKTVAGAVPGGGRLVAMPCDVSQPEQVGALFGRIKDEFGRLDVLFNNAGVSTAGTPIEDLTFEAWSTVVNINLNGAFLCAQAAFRLMKDQMPRGGRIINNGSISAVTPRPNHVAYTATKHAITGLTKSFSLDGRKYDIACSQIDIGNAATDMTQRMEQGALQADGSRKVEPRMDVRHVAEMVVYIANLPLEANVQFMTIMATKMPFIGRG